MHNSTHTFCISLGYPCLVSVRDEDDESYSKYLRRLNEARDKADRATPQGLTTQQRMDELMLSVALSGLWANGSLRR